MKCCDKELTTRFCPHCGTDFRDQSPLGQLLRHCQQVIRNKKGHIKGLEKRIRVPRPRERWPELLRTWLTQAQARLATWEAWAEALAEAMGKKQ